MILAYFCGMVPFISNCHARSCIGDLKRLPCEEANVAMSKTPGHKAITRTPVKL